MKVVLLPGMDGGSLSESFLKHLPDYIEPYLVQYPNEGDQSYERLTSQALSLMPEKEEFVLIAESFSGPIAVRIANAKLENLKGIIFVASFVNAPLKLPQRFSKIIKLPLVRSKLFLRGGQFFTFGRWTTSALNDQLYDAVNQSQPNVIQSRINSILALDDTVRFIEISCPIGYIRPTRDKLISKKLLNKMHGLKPEMLIEKVEGPHFILQTKPVECANAISKIIDKILN